MLSEDSRRLFSKGNFTPEDEQIRFRFCLCHFHSQRAKADGKNKATTQSFELQGRTKLQQRLEGPPGASPRQCHIVPHQRRASFTI